MDTSPTGRPAPWAGSFTKGTRIVFIERGWIIAVLTPVVKGSENFGNIALPSFKMFVLIAFNHVYLYIKYSSPA